MKQKLIPNKDINFLSPEEFLAGMKDHTHTLLAALGRNARFVRRVALAEPVIPTGDVTKGMEAQVSFTPPDGFLWCVMASGSFFSGTYKFTTNVIGVNSQYAGVGVGAVDMASTLYTNPINTDLRFFSKNQVIVHPTDTLFAYASGVTDATGQISLPLVAVLHVIEVPTSHEAQLLL